MRLKLLAWFIFGTLLGVIANILLLVILIIPIILVCIIGTEEDVMHAIIRLKDAKII